MSKIKGFKVFLPGWICRPNGNFKQYACPGKFEEDVALIPRKQGMHFCETVADCFDYYEFDPNNKVAEVLAYGQVVRDGDQFCTDKIELVREIPWKEVLRIVNTGKNNTGRNNTGNGNTGDDNTGHNNTGHRNTGDDNTGHDNTGHNNTGYNNTGNKNAGHENTGYNNTGHRNTGCGNTGNRNSGHNNAGYDNTGHNNTGYNNTGNNNTGHNNTGNNNTGHNNTGYNNAGYDNTGDENTGNGNTGNKNTGYGNTGDWNTGHRNTGNWNTGDWNTSNRNTGFFMTENQPIMMFNKQSDWTYEDWIESDARQLLNSIPRDVVKWIDESDMTDCEKIACPTYKTTSGYLKELEKSESSQLWWNALPEADRASIQALPNFDTEIFEEVTGIRCGENA